MRRRSQTKPIKVCGPDLECHFVRVHKEDLAASVTSVAYTRTLEDDGSVLQRNETLGCPFFILLSFPRSYRTSELWHPEWAYFRLERMQESTLISNSAASRNPIALFHRDRLREVTIQLSLRSCLLQYHSPRSCSSVEVLIDLHCPKSSAMTLPYIGYHKRVKSW